MRNLAEKTQKSLGEINITINTIVQSVEDVSARVRENADSMNDLVDISEKSFKKMREAGEKIGAINRLSQEDTENSKLIDEEVVKAKEKVDRLYDKIEEDSKFIDKSRELVG